MLKEGARGGAELRGGRGQEQGRGLGLGGGWEGLPPRVRDPANAGSPAWDASSRSGRLSP